MVEVVQSSIFSREDVDWQGYVVCPGIEEAFSQKRCTVWEKLISFGHRYGGFMFHWVIEEQLARGKRPGYGGGRRAQVPRADVDKWIDEAKSTYAIKSIICLLGQDQLDLYASLPADLVSYYRGHGFEVEHIPVHDHQRPPLSDTDLARVWSAYKLLPKPVLVHCSAGVDRTVKAVEHIKRQLGL